MVTDDDIEHTYWEFDARKRGLGRWKFTPQSERDAFKWAVRELLLKAREPALTLTPAIKTQP